MDKPETIAIYYPTFITKDTTEQANQVNLKEYRWSERMSATLGKFVFVRRAK
jgi:hypothetical protein